MQMEEKKKFKYKKGVNRVDLNLHNKADPQRKKYIIMHLYKYV